MKKLSLKAILIGGIVDYVLGRLFFALPVVYVALDIRRHDDSFEGMLTAALAAIENSLTLHYVQIGGGFFATFIAGYVAARIANKNEWLNGLLAALPCGLLSIYRVVTTTDTTLASHMAALMIAIAFACALLGGVVRGLQRRANTRLATHQ